MADKTCPRCSNPTKDLLPLEAGLKLALNEAGKPTDNLTVVCPRCYEDLTSEMSQGLKLRVKHEAREKNKAVLWKSRVNLIKQARQLMQQKSYSEAAVAYEKYLKVLEIVYDRKPGTLGPDIFNKSTRSRELTVIASVYWDLLRIYDTNPKFVKRMGSSAGKLAEFLPYSPLYPDIVKKAEGFARTAKNPQMIKSFLRASKSKKGKCFIATAVFEDGDHPTLCRLRMLRDFYLARHGVGRIAIRMYYYISPPIAGWISDKTTIKKVLRHIFNFVA